MKKEIKILHCIYDSPGNKWVNGGGAYRTVEIYKRFPDNYKITILSGNHSSVKTQMKNIKFIYLGFKFNYFFSRISYLYFSRRYIKKFYNQYDLIIEDFTPYSPLKSYKYKNSILLLQNYFGKNLLKKFFIVGGLYAYFNELRMISKYKYKIFSSEYLRNKILNLLKKPGFCKVISYGIDKKLFSLKSLNNDYILYLGRIEIYQKGLDILIETIKELPKVKLIVAGNGKDEKIFLKRIKDIKNIEFVGRINGKKKYDYLRKTKFVVMPSRYESFGIVAIESAAVGKPVIGTRNTGLENAIVHMKTGILLKNLTKESLKKAIIKLYNNQKLQKKMGINGKIFARRFDWDKLYKKQMEFYNKCIYLIGEINE